jgi:hypothetical protein
MNAMTLAISLCLIGGVLAVCGVVVPMVFDYRFNGDGVIRLGVVCWIAGAVACIGSLVWSAL